jgi:hypothetical protein
MAEFDLNSEVKIAMAITPVAATAIADGSVIDTLGFESVVFAIFSGTLGTGTIDFQLEESDVITFGGEENDVAAGDLIGSTPTVLAGEDDAVFRFGYKGKKRFLRLQNIETAAWTSMIHGAVCILSNPVIKPVAAQIT